MNEVLTQHFLSLKWDGSTVTTTPNITKDNVISVLNNTFNEWSYEILSVNQINGQMVVVVALYMPGKVICGMGPDDSAALLNIICSLHKEINSVPEKNLNTEQIQQNNQTKTLTSKDVVQRLEDIQNKISSQSQPSQTPPTAQNNGFPDLLSDMLGNSIPQQQTAPVAQQNAPQEDDYSDLPFTMSEDFANSFQEPKKFVPSPETINPNHTIMIRQWKPEQGQKFSAWCKENNVSSKAEAEAWIKRYCGLTYDYFNPDYVDDFIRWAKELREKQTY